MKAKKSSNARRRKKEPEPEWVKQARAAAPRMGRMVREENLRWGLPLIVERNGKIIEIPA
jgi:hypothetical protein